jgi:hypothetical protein
MKEIPYFGELLSPEFYHEIQGFESRLAILKLNDVRETLGDCLTSLIYSDSEEQKNIANTFELNVIRRFHVRHAVVDLNSCYDLLLQVPWFFYRMWKSYNKGGKYHNRRGTHYIDVVRGASNWVEIAEVACSPDKVAWFLNNSSDTSLKQLAEDYKKFRDEYIFNETKPFTVRTLTNSIKHNSSLKIKELREPWNLNLTAGERVINPKENNLGVEIKTNFFKPEDIGAKPLGEVRVNYTDDLYVDIEYSGGEVFYGKDYVRKGQVYSVEDLHKEAVAYYDNFIDLFEKVYSNINLQVFYSPIVTRDGFKNSTDSINLDKYFKISD